MKITIASFILSGLLFTNDKGYCFTEDDLKKYFASQISTPGKLNVQHLEQYSKKIVSNPNYDDFKTIAPLLYAFSRSIPDLPLSQCFKKLSSILCKKSEESKETPAYKTCISIMQNISDHWAREELEQAKLLEKKLKEEKLLNETLEKQKLLAKRVQEARALEIEQKLKEVRRLEIEQKLKEQELLKKRRTAITKIPDQFKI
ncbi:hypothetical protein [Holospora curviuscula]|uniref:Uncharacterized protein n=1 Tax=Holospora curviuscula TaxID=1082868 RepID=A0A2S5R787_9PROT|nr:hypothetical protein [Holospora curviuscula]PPE03188.1 hypothetical protein HCUR_01366 [Holospora curviuscula]